MPGAICQDDRVPADADPTRVLELLRSYEAILEELIQRGVSRTYDAPVGQYAEWLAEQRLDGKRAANAEKSYDLTCPDFGKVQVEARIARGHSKRGEKQLSPFRSFDFCHALVLIFESDYTVQSATILSVEQLLAVGRR